MEYFRRNPRLDISDETKLNADEQTSKAYYSEKLEGNNNFISEIFFLAVAANHYGILAAQTTHQNLYRDLTEMEKSIPKLKAEIERLKAANVSFRRAHRNHIACYSLSLEPIRRSLVEKSHEVGGED